MALPVDYNEDLVAAKNVLMEATTGDIINDDQLALVDNFKKSTDANSEMTVKLHSLLKYSNNSENQPPSSPEQQFYKSEQISKFESNTPKFNQRYDQNVEEKG